MNRSFTIVAFLVCASGCSAASPDPVTATGALRGGGSTTCSPDACGDKPEIGVVCNDGSTAELVCREAGGQCGWTDGCPASGSTNPSPAPTKCGASSCGPKPEILPICSDDAVGDLDCRAEGNACGWQSTCADDPNTPVSSDAGPHTPVSNDAGPHTPVSNDAGPHTPVSNDAGPVSCGASACGPKPEIGVICSDNSVGDLMCAPANGTCDWVRTCQ